MSECTSIISETHVDVSTSATSVAMKKYAAIKSTSKSTVTQTQLLSHSTLQIMVPTTPKGPQHSQGRS